MGKFSNGQTDIPFETFSIQQLNEIEERKINLVEHFYQLDYNYATVTKFKDGTAIIFPGNGRGYGLLFYDLDTMQVIIDSRKFPVKSNANFWESEKDRILLLEKNISFYLRRASILLGMDLEISTDKSYLMELSKKISERFKRKKIKSEEYFIMAIYISELIRYKNNGKWMLLPEYTLNIYYVPEIVVGDLYCEPIGHVIRRLEEIRYIDIDVERIIEEIDLAPLGNRDYIDRRF